MKNPFPTSSQPTAPLTLNNAEYITVQTLRRNGHLTRTTIANMTSYSASKLTKVTTDLIDDEIIVEVDEGGYTGGRRAKELFFNPSFGYFVAMVINLNKLEIAIVDFSETVRSRQMLSLQPSTQPGEVLSQILTKITTRLNRLDIPIERVYGVGVTLPGAVNRTDGILYDTPILPGWGGYQIGSFIRENFPYAIVRIERDTHAMAFAELRRGQGKLHKNFIYVHIGHTISAGLIIDGKIYYGANGRAGDIGNLSVEADGQIVKLYDLTLQTDSIQTNMNYLEDLSVAAQEGNTEAQAFIETIALQVGNALSTLVTLIDPEIILIGGLAQQWGHLFLAPIRRHILKLSQSSSTQHLQVDIAPLGNEATVTGIVALTAEQVFVAEP